MLSKLRGFELPLVLGRDVSGDVVAVGERVKDLVVGQAVFGVSSTKAQGSYAQLVVAKASEVVAKPSELTYERAAAFPYVICTVWDALVGKAGLNESNARGKKVFVQGGAGGIGMVAIQLLKAWGASVATTCSGKNVADMRALGADVVIDYQQADYAAQLSGYDVALETVGGSLEGKTLSILRKDGQGCFVTLIHPLLRNFDEKGLLRGAIANLCQFRRSKRIAVRQGVGHYHWSTFKPSAKALTVTSKLVESGQMSARIDGVFGLTDIALAHERVELGQASGKVVIRID